MKAIVSRLTNSCETQEGKEEISERRPWINAGRKNGQNVLSHSACLQNAKEKTKDYLSTSSW